ncbi:MAG: MFS transporter [Bdellovibrionia bacterium]
METNSIDNKKAQLAIIFLTVFIYLVGFGVIIPILPILSRDFGATALQTGLLLSVYSVMQFVFAPFWGGLSDRFGRRPIIVFCLLMEGLSYILFAFARNLEMLFVARLLAGFFGASLSTASAYIGDVTSEKERSKGMALIGAAFGLGFVVGPALGGGLTVWAQSISQEPHFDTSFAAFWVAGICFATFIFAFKFLKESLDKSKRTQQKKKRFQLLWNYLQRPTINSLMIVFGLCALAMSAMEATLILYMGDRFAWTIKEVSFGFAYIGILIVFTQGFLVRKLLPMWGERQVLSLGLFLFVVGLGLIPVSENLSLMAIAMTLLSIGNGLCNPSVMGSISLLADAQEQGSAMGVTQSLSALGRILGPALGGFIYQAWFIGGPFIFSSALAAVALIMVLVNFKNLPQQAKV